MIITQRQVVLALIGATTIVCLVTLAYYLATGTSPEAVGSTAVIGIVFGGLFGLYYRYHWEPARYIAATTIALIAAFTIPTGTEFIAAFVPIVFALALTNTRWVAGIGVTVYLMLLVRGLFADGTNTYLTVGTASSYVLALISTALGSMALDAARRNAEHRAEDAQIQRENAERRAAEVEQQSTELNAQNQRQRELLDLVSTLETPTVSIAEGVLLAPVVGNIDTRRAEMITRRLLDAVHQQRTRLVILDVAGISLIDTAVARAITDMVRAVKLLGCNIVITGISAGVATTLTNIGAALQDIETAASPQEALSNVRGKG